MLVMAWFPDAEKVSSASALCFNDLWVLGRLSVHQMFLGLGAAAMRRRYWHHYFQEGSVGLSSKLILEENGRQGKVPAYQKSRLLKHYKANSMCALNQNSQYLEFYYVYIHIHTYILLYTFTYVSVCGNTCIQCCIHPLYTPHANQGLTGIPRFLL